MKATDWLRVAAATAIMYAAFTLGGCGSVDPVYLEADRAFFDAVAPSWTAYVLADPTLDQAQKDRRLRTVAAKKALLDAAEAEQ